MTCALLRTTTRSILMSIIMCVNYDTICVCFKAQCSNLCYIGVTSSLRPAQSGDLVAVEVFDVVHNRFEIVFHGEVARVKFHELRVGQVSQICVAACRREEDVPLTPEDDCLRLSRT